MEAGEVWVNKYESYTTGNGLTLKPELLLDGE